jgi:tetratricopeptide (TPR) repeat protein
LAYGFEEAFDEEERKKLALLHLFQGFVDVTTLCIMGDPEVSWCLPEIRGLTEEEGIVFLDRAAEVGLLVSHDSGYYEIHPALPWFFKDLFERCYPPEGLAAVRAFVEAMGELGNYYAAEYQRGNRDVLGALGAEEANLLQARRLARSHGWWDPVISTMQGLQMLYDHTGRRAEWKRLVEEIVPDFLDPENDGPRLGREEEWSLVAQYRVQLAQEERQWAEAERLQTTCVEWDRRRAASALARPVEELESGERYAIRALAVSLHGLGEIRRNLGRAECVSGYEEALELSERIGERVGAATCAFNLGHAFSELPALRDLDQAERWYRKSLELFEERDRLGRGRCVRELGTVALVRSRAAEQPREELFRQLNEVVRLYYEALDLLPEDEIHDLAVIQHQLGQVYRSAGDLDRAVQHYRESIHYEEMQGNLYGAAQTRGNMALALARAGRKADALEYAEAALQGFESLGERAAADIEDTHKLIAAIRG